MQLIHKTSIIFYVKKHLTLDNDIVTIKKESLDVS